MNLDPLTSVSRRYRTDEEDMSIIEYQADEADTGIQVNCPLDVTSDYLKSFPVHNYLGLSFPSKQFIRTILDCYWLKTSREF